ncbi:TolC family protein [Achromobacter sp. SIMBA_011]|uniref:TolC family protein n=1 Tax=Achromobacter TaxID=222 RepID=UPI0022B872DD|nr:TolC family protein [Achromobacter dolens]MCZ8406387.1 TolC family protein [Achromobacter dolens]
MPSMFSTLLARRGWLRLHGLFASLILGHGLAYGQVTAVTLDDAVRLAATDSPASQAARSSVEASVQAAVKAGQLPNPMLSAGIDNLPVNGPDRFSATQDMLSMRRIGVEQEWVSAAKRRLQSAQADAMVDHEKTAYLSQVASLRQRAAQAWLDAAYAKKAVALQREWVDQTRRELAAAGASLQGAKSGAADVTRAQALLGQAQDQLLLAEQQWRTALVRLSRWTARPVTDVAGEPPPPRSAVETFTLDQLRQMQPSLIEAAHAIKVAETDTALADANRAPNWTWNVSYLQGSRASRYVSVGVSIPLTFNHANVEDREVAQKAALGNKARYAYEDTLRQVQADTQALAETLASGRRRLENLKQTLLPAAARTAQLALAAYQGGSGALADVYGARRAQLDARLQILALQRDLSMTWAQLDYQVVPLAMVMDH